jgi:prophage DNA circulation protein
MNLSSVPVQNPSVLSRQIVDNEMVLVNADSAASLALTNQTALIVWELVNDTRSVQDIIDSLKERFNQVPDSVVDDIVGLLELLAQDGFIGFEVTRKAQH